MSLRHARRWASALLVGVPLTGCRTAGAPSPTPTPDGSAEERAPILQRAEGVRAPTLLGPAAPLPGVGETASARDVELTLVSASRCTPPTWAPPQPGHFILGLLVDFSGKTPHAVRINSLDARLVLGDRTIEPTFTGCTPDLRAGTVRLGERARGYVNFEVPLEAERAQLRYEVHRLGTPPDELGFELHLGALRGPPAGGP